MIEVFGAGRVGMKLSPGGGYNDMGYVRSFVISCALFKLVFRMPIKDTLETFGYFIKEADKLGIAYIILVRYDASQAPVFDGKPPSPSSYTIIIIIINGR